MLKRTALAFTITTLLGTSVMVFASAAEEAASAPVDIPPWQ